MCVCEFVCVCVCSCVCVCVCVRVCVGGCMGVEGCGGGSVGAFVTELCSVKEGACEVIAEEVSLDRKG